MLRKTIFWNHLVCGIVTGVVVLIMSATGVLLTYERQILAWVDRGHFTEPRPDTAAIPIAGLVAAVHRHDPAFEVGAVTLHRDPRAPAVATADRSGTLHIDRYSGAVVLPDGTRLREFFNTMTGWHRWFNASRENRTLPRAMTGASNLAFLFLILSGLYLWLPPTYRWAMFRTRLLFNPKAISAKARDFNWHHVFGVWSSIPLIVVVATAVVFSYGWANDLVYLSFGEEPPVRDLPAGGPSGARAKEQLGSLESGPTPMSLDALFDRASRQVDDWKTITLQLPSEGSENVQLTIDQGTGGQPQKRHSLTLDTYTGTVDAWRPFDSQSIGRQARSWIRFLHTGEALGVIGQTIAGLVSLTSLVMVWTGLALAYRRLLAPLFRRHQQH